jgi:hypothetical protein
MVAKVQAQRSGNHRNAFLDARLVIDQSISTMIMSAILGIGWAIQKRLLEYVCVSSWGYNHFQHIQI